MTLSLEIVSTDKLLYPVLFKIQHWNYYETQPGLTTAAINLNVESFVW